MEKPPHDFNRRIVHADASYTVMRELESGNGRPVVLHVEKIEDIKSRLSPAEKRIRRACVQNVFDIDPDEPLESDIKTL